MSYEVRVTHGVEEVGQSEWDSVGEAQPFASYKWYRYCEMVFAGDLPIYVTLYYAGAPLARATFWLKSQESLPTRARAVRFIADSVLRYRPLLACRSPISGMSGLILPAPPHREPALKTILLTAQELARKHRISFLLFDYLDPAQMSWSGWPDDYVRMADTSPGTRLAISWTDFGSYLAHLGKKRRYNVRRNYRLVAEDGIRIVQHPAVMDLDRAMALHRNVNKRHHVPTALSMRPTMAHAEMVDAVWLAAEEDGQLVGCELMLGDRGTWLVTGLGLDYSVSNVYFVLGYEDIRYAIEQGAQALRWGSEACDVKGRLGFEPEGYNNLIFSSRWIALQRFGRCVAKQSLYGSGS